jgi:hypothetical protein
MERHHVCGRQHAPFTADLCRRHHEEITAALRLAGVKMTPTSAKLERHVRALKALAVWLWLLASSFRRDRRSLSSRPRH